MSIFLFVIFFLSLYYCKQGNKALALFLFFNYSNGFGFIDPGLYKNSLIHIGYMGILYFLYIAYTQNRDCFKFNGDSIAKVVGVLSLYFFLHFIGSVLLNVDSPKNCLQSYLANIPWLMFFYIREFNKEEAKSFFKYTFVLSVAQGFFYYLQFWGIRGVLNGGDVGILEDVRFYNQPFWSMIILLYILVSSFENVSYRYFLLLFFLPLPILSQGRGIVIALGLTVLVYMIINRKKRNVILLIGSLIFYQIAVEPMFERRDKYESASTLTEFRTVLSNPISVYNEYDSDNGTLSFRIAMLMERVMFITENPQYFMFGVGDVYDESKFYFSLGTRNETSYHGRTILSSVDIDWVEPTIKYGVLGVIIYLFLYIIWWKNGLKIYRRNKEDGFLVMAFMYCVYAFSSSFGTSPLHRRLYIAIFCLAVISIYIKQLNEQRE